MKRFLKKFFFLFLAAFLFITWSLWSETGRQLTRSSAQLFYKVAAKITFHPLRATRDYFTSRHTLRRENKKLRAQMTSLEQELVQAREIQKENERLRALLRFQEEVGYRAIPARVVGRDPTQWFRGITIDKGLRDGLKANMPVVTHEGLVGKIAELSASMAQVRLIVDYSSRVGALLQEQREVGILTGEGALGCRVIYLSRHAALAPGERVLTSGLGSLYPKGLVVGKVRDVAQEKGGLYQSARVDLAVDFGKLEEVLVLVSTQ